MSRGVPLLLLALSCCAAPGQNYLGKREDAWLKELKEGDAKQRRAAAAALGKIGQASNPALAGLVTALGDGEASVRDGAAFALGEIAVAGDADRVRVRAVQPLLDRLGDADARVRRSAAYALGACRAGRDAEAGLLKALSDRQANVRRSAAWALARSGTAASPEAVRALTDALAGEDDALALRDLAGALGEIGRPRASEAAEPLARVLQRSSDTVVRRTALASLLTLVGSELAKAPPGTHENLVKALREALRTGDGETRGLVAGALDQLGEHAAPALQDLADLAGDERAPEAARRNAVVAITKLTPVIQKMQPEQARGIVGSLARNLDPKQPVDVRKFTAEVLARIGFPQIEPAAPALIAAIIADGDDTVRHRSAWAFLNADDLEKIPGAVDALRKALKDSHSGVRYDAARCLARGLGPKAGEDVIDVLDTMLHDPKIKVYYKTDASVKGGSESSGGQSSVTPDVGGDARFMAAQALGFIGPAAKRDRIVKTLKEMTTSKDPEIRDHATKALARIGG